MCVHGQRVLVTQLMGVEIRGHPLDDSPCFPPCLRQDQDLFAALSWASWPVNMRSGFSPHFPLLCWDYRCF